MLKIDREQNIPAFSDMCLFCKHWDVTVKRFCAAFPEGIPMEIWMGENKHREAYAGDHRLQFEAALEPTTAK